MNEERILGHKDVVESLLKEQEEQMERRYRLKEQGYDFENKLKLIELRISQFHTCPLYRVC